MKTSIRKTQNGYRITFAGYPYWNEIREHARKLQAALKLTEEELESLPA